LEVTERASERATREEIESERLRGPNPNPNPHPNPNWRLRGVLDAEEEKTRGLEAEKERLREVVKENLSGMTEAIMASGGEKRDMLIFEQWKSSEETARSLAEAASSMKMSLKEAERARDLALKKAAEAEALNKINRDRVRILEKAENEGGVEERFQKREKLWKEEMRRLEDALSKKVGVMKDLAQLSGREREEALTVELTKIEQERAKVGASLVEYQHEVVALEEKLKEEEKEKVRARVQAGVIEEEIQVLREEKIEMKALNRRLDSGLKTKDGALNGLMEQFRDIEAALEKKEEVRQREAHSALEEKDSALLSLRSELEDKHREERVELEGAVKEMDLEISRFRDKERGGLSVMDVTTLDYPHKGEEAPDPAVTLLKRSTEALGLLESEIEYFDVLEHVEAISTHFRDEGRLIHAKVADDFILRTLP